MKIVRTIIILVEIQNLLRIFLDDLESDNLGPTNYVVNK